MVALNVWYAGCRTEILTQSSNWRTVIVRYYLHKIRCEWNDGPVVAKVINIDCIADGVEATVYSTSIVTLRICNFDDFVMLFEQTGSRIMLRNVIQIRGNPIFHESAFRIRGILEANESEVWIRSPKKWIYRLFRPFRKRNGFRFRFRKS